MMRVAVIVLSVLAALLSPVSEVRAQGAPAASGGSWETSPDYQLGPGDLVSVNVSGVREFAYSARVSNSGRIRVPYVGVMYVAGMTAGAVEHDVARLIKEHELVKEPAVRVHVEEYRARPTYVIGEVNAPGQFVITGEMYVLDLLSKAGGLLPAAEEYGYLYRRHLPRPAVESRVISGVATTAPPKSAVPEVHTTRDQAVGDTPAKTSVPGGEEVVRINFQELRSGTKPELNLRLQGGDVLYVPRRKPENIFIIGDVKVPGAYTLPRRGRITAAQALIYAGGPMATAKTSKGFLMRHNDAGVREALPVDFAKIIEGKQPDIPVQPNDIIYVPNSSVKTIGVGLLNLVPRLIQQFAIF